MKPTVGRIVHFYPSESDIPDETPFAAIIVRVHSEDCVNLKVFCDGTTGGDSLFTSVTNSTKPKCGYWMWPPRG